MYSGTSCFIASTTSRAVEALRYSHQSLDALMKPVAVHRAILPDADFGMRRRQHVFAFDGKLFKKFFAGTKAGEFDFDILAGAESR